MHEIFLANPVNKGFSASESFHPIFGPIVLISYAYVSLFTDQNPL